MKHQDGVHVTISQLHGDQFMEVANAYEKHHDNYSGAFGSRLVAAQPGSAFQINVTFDTNFRLFNADGVLVVITCGSATDLIMRRDNPQSHWLDRTHMSINGEHTFTAFTLWSSAEADASTRKIPMEVPQHDPTYAVASADWMVESIYSANDGCISVCIERGKLNDRRDEEAHYRWGSMDPPNANRALRISGPKVIRSEWFKPLRSVNGLPYLFEYRFVEEHEIDGVEEEDGEIGHAPEGLDFDNIENETVSNNGLSNADETDEYVAESSSRRRKPKGRSQANLQATQYKVSRPRISYFLDEAGKKLDRGDNSKLSPLDSRMGAVILPNGKRKQCDIEQEDQDDEEILPMAPPNAVKRESEDDGETRRTQEPTPPLDQRSAYVEGAGLATTTNVASTMRQSANVIEAVDLTMSEDGNDTTIKAEPEPPLAEEEMEDFEYQRREARIVRDYELKMAEIDRKALAKARKSRAAANV